jgi:hypothetical protein
MQRLETYDNKEHRDFAVVAPNGDRIAVLEDRQDAQTLADTMSTEGMAYTVLDLRQ